MRPAPRYSQDLFDSATEITPYTTLAGIEALVANLIVSGSDAAAYSTPIPEIEKQIINLSQKFMEVIDGGIRIKDFFKKLEEASTGNEEVLNDIRKFIRVTRPGSIQDPGRHLSDSPNYSYLNDVRNYTGYENESESTEYTLASGGILQNGKNLEEEGSRIYAIELLNPRLGLPSRNTPYVSIFTSMIPTLEMSRCVPYVNIRLSTTGSIVSTVDKKRYSGISLMTYLNGMGSKIENNSTLNEFLSFNEAGSKTSSGMEVFTSPQTLVPERNSEVFKEVRDIGGMNIANDRFRPFMTLRSIDLSVKPTKGDMSHTSGKIEIVLHDRSRLGEVTQLISPGIYATTDLDIEFGWSHPAGNENYTQNQDKKSKFKNPVGTFLNSLKRREKFTITSPSFSMDETGQINISLNIFTKSVTDILMTNISNADGEEAARAIQEILERIGKELKEEEGRKKFKNIFGEVVLSAVGSTSAALSIDNKKLEELRSALDKLKSKSSGVDQNIQLIVESLDNLFRINEGEIDKYKNSAAKRVDDQIRSLTQGIEIFHFHNDQIKDNNRKNFNLIDNQLTGVEVEAIDDPISLGRILVSFIGKPLYRNKKYKEIHFIFHCFNHKCSFMKDMSIAKFPIPSKDLKDALTEYMKKNEAVSITDFMTLINSRFVSNAAAHAYGLRFKYEIDDKGNAKPRDPSNEGEKADPEGFRADIEAKEDTILKLAGVGRYFELPKLSLIPECVPIKDSQGESILRLHVVDNTCKAYSEISDLLVAASQFGFDDSGFLSDQQIDKNHPILDVAPEFSEIKKNRTETMARLKSNNIVKQSENSFEVDMGTVLDTLEVKGSVREVKKFVSRNLPIIRYGASNGVINRATFQSLADPSLTNIAILNSDKFDAKVAELPFQRGIPMTVFPTECSIDMMGCPLLSYMQQFFVDFGTGTTADSIYAVTGIDHKITPGSFITSAKLVPMTTYARYQSVESKVKRMSDTLKVKHNVPATKKSGPKTGSGGKTKKKVNKNVTFFDSVGVPSETVREITEKFFKLGAPAYFTLKLNSEFKHRDFLYEFSNGNYLANGIVQARNISALTQLPSSDFFLLGKIDFVSVANIMNQTLLSSNRRVFKVEVRSGKTKQLATIEELKTLDRIGDVPTTGNGVILVNYDDIVREFNRIRVQMMKDAPPGSVSV